MAGWRISVMNAESLAYFDFFEHPDRFFVVQRFFCVFSKHKKHADATGGTRVSTAKVRVILSEAKSTTNKVLSFCEVVRIQVDKKTCAADK